MQCHPARIFKFDLSLCLPSVIEPLVMSHNVTPHNGGRCSVWECEEPVLAASLCQGHQSLADSPGFLDGPAPPSSPVSSLHPTTTGVKHTAKRTKRFFIRRSEADSTPIKTERPQLPGDSGSPTLFDPTKNESTTKNSPSDRDAEPYPTPIGQAPYQPPKTANARFTAVNTILFKTASEDVGSASSTIQQPVVQSNLNIPSTNGDKPTTERHLETQDMAKNRHVSKTVDNEGIAGLMGGVVGNTAMSSRVSMGVARISKQPNEPLSFVSANLYPPTPPVLFERAYTVEVHSDVVLGKRKACSIEQEESSQFDFLNKPKRPRPAPVDDIYRVQHSTEVGIPLSTSAKGLDPNRDKELESSSQNPSLVSSDAGSRKGLGNPERELGPRTKSTSSARAREANLKTRKESGSSTTSTKHRVNSKNSDLRLPEHVRVDATFSVDLCSEAEEPPNGSPNSRHDQPTKLSSGEQSFQSRSTSDDMAPSTPKEISMVNRVNPTPLVPAEERRRARILKFDSAAFDAMIYGQSEMTPPPGVALSANPQKPTTPAHNDKRLYLPTNPYIHLLHNRSEEWHREKALEIKARGGRKAWFGKAVARELWLQAKEKAEQKRKKATRSEPQPRTHSRIMDFGDVPPEDLPEDVLQNPAWVKACAWHRENQAKSIFRERAARHRRQKAWNHCQSVIEVVEKKASKR